MSLAQPRLPSNWQLTEVASSAELNGRPISLWHFTAQLPPAQEAQRLRALWRQTSKEMLVEQSLPDGQVISQRDGDAWHTVKLKPARFGRSEGVYGHSRMFSEKRIRPTPPPFAWPGDLRLLSQHGSNDSGIRGDLWVLQGRAPITGLARGFEDALKCQGAVSDPHVRYPGPASHAYAAMFNGPKAQWSLTLERRDGQSYAVLNRMQRGS